MDYSKFKVEDFVTDEYFLRWVKRPDDQSNAFWNAWLSKNPGSAESIRAAREIILHLDFKTTKPPEGKFLEVWDKIVRTDSGTLKTVYDVEAPAAPSGTQRKLWTYRIAAGIAILAAVVYLFVRPGINHQEISTSFGESRTVSLPDSTKVTLNSNSKISFSPLAASNGIIEVFLQGEAFFSVTHKSGKEKFVVHTNEMNIEVVGTKFNVNSRRGHTKVILKEGKVLVNNKANSSEGRLEMNPGEYVELSSGGDLQRRTVDADNYLEWRNNRLIFVSTSLEEIAQLLEDNYGYEVIFEDDSIRQREFTGSSSTVEIEELLEKLSRVYDLEVKKNGSKITVKKNREEK